MNDIINNEAKEALEVKSSLNESEEDKSDEKFEKTNMANTIPEKSDEKFDDADLPTTSIEYGKYAEFEYTPQRGFMAVTETEQNQGKLDENLNTTDENRVKNESGLPEQSNPTYYNPARIDEDAHIYESTIAPTEQLLYTDADGNTQEAYRQVNDDGVSTGEYLDQDGNKLSKEDITIQLQEGGGKQVFVSDGTSVDYSGAKEFDNGVKAESSFTPRSDKSIEEIRNDPMYSDLISQGYSEESAENIVGSSSDEWEQKQ